MDKIEVRKVKTKFLGIQLNIFINDISLDVFLAQKTGDKSMIGLYHAWGNELICKNEKEFVHDLLDKKDKILNIPILLCPDDLDFSCTIICAKIEVSEDFVYFRDVGQVNNLNYDLKEELESGILLVGKYTDIEKKTYGDKFLGMDIDSIEWKEWVFSNWNKEKKLRLKNYMYPYLQDDKNIDWFGIETLKFSYYDYKNCIDSYKNRC